MFVCLFVCSQNAKTTERIDAKRSGITKNDPESALRGLRSPVLVLSGRYRDMSGFSFAADHRYTHHRISMGRPTFLLSPFHFRLAKTAATARPATDNSSPRKPSHLKRISYILLMFHYVYTVYQECCLS